MALVFGFSRPHVSIDSSRLEREFRKTCLLNQALFFALKQRIPLKRKKYFKEEILKLISFYRLPRALLRVYVT